MTTDERYRFECYRRAVDAILSNLNERNIEIPSNLLQSLKNANKALDDHELIKAYKRQERVLYQDGRTKEYHELKKMRLALEKDLQY